MFRYYQYRALPLSYAGVFPTIYKTLIMMVWLKTVFQGSSWPEASTNRQSPQISPDKYPHREGSQAKGSTIPPLPNHQVELYAFQQFNTRFNSVHGWNRTNNLLYVAQAFYR